MLKSSPGAPFAQDDSGEGGVFKQGGVLVAEDAEQCRTFTGEETDEGFPAFKGKMAFVKVFAALNAMPCIDELARGVVFHCATDCEFHAFHRCLVKLIVSQIAESRAEEPGVRHLDNRSNHYLFRDTLMKLFKRWL